MTMKRVLLLFIAIVLMAFSSVAPSYAQQYRTIESEMKVTHESLGVNFVYDSSMDLNVPYYGKPMVYIIKGNSKDKSEVLAECLKNLFAGTNIECEIMKKYVVLTQSDKRKGLYYFH